MSDKLNPSPSSDQHSGGNSPHNHGGGLLRGDVRFICLFLGPALAAMILLLPPIGGLSASAWGVVAITAWMVVWWLSEAIPIPATSLLPIAFYPVLNILDIKTTTASYAHPLIFLFLGGFILAAAMQRCGLHRRIALGIIGHVGTSPPRIVAGFMLATAFLSMWISNTATTIMMISVAIPIIDLQREQMDDEQQLRNFSVALMLGIAYSASIGGVGTLIGTPPNALLASALQATYNIEVDFVTWMMCALPVVIVMLPIAWVVLTKFLYPVEAVPRTDVEGDVGAGAHAAHLSLAPMSQDEKMVLGVFLFAATGWIFGSPIAEVIGLAITDTTVAIVAALLLFSLPTSLRNPRFLLDWESTRSIPWGILLMLGGGLAIAAAFGSSGLAAAIGASMSGFSQYGLWIFALLATALIIALTEITSNTASAATFLPILGAIAIGLGVDPRALMIPVTFGASMAFMMPVATAPNAIVFSHKDVHITDMVRTGIWLNIMSVAVCFTAGFWLASVVFGYSVGG
ncbi:MAG: DASS family sodium-coupled anion symporter [Alphaproteobacteria bacterium]|nr:DASS family sodium-coupled anion symporter [Alphaproteobacteria bacterium]